MSKPISQDEKRAAILAAVAGGLVSCRQLDSSSGRGRAISRLRAKEISPAKNDEIYARLIGEDPNASIRLQPLSERDVEELLHPEEDPASDQVVERIRQKFADHRKQRDLDNDQVVNDPAAWGEVARRTNLGRMNQ